MTLLALVGSLACEAPSSPASEGERPGLDGKLDDTQAQPTWEAFAEPGVFEVLEESDEHQTSRGCEMPYDVYVPSDEDADRGAMVMLAHGFKREPAQMAEHARQLASWGLTTVVPRLCHRSVFDADHVGNGEDMAELAEALGVSSVFFVGYSAGGISALAACSDDPERCAGVVGLDPVDDGNAEALAAELTVPIAALFGEPQRCNRSNNGLEVWRLHPQARALRVDGSTHCDFENPTTTSCTVVCRRDRNAPARDALVPTITAMMTSYIVAAMGVVPSGAALWDPESESYEALQGALTELDD